MSDDAPPDPLPPYRARIAKAVYNRPMGYATRNLWLLICRTVTNMPELEYVLREIKYDLEPILPPENTNE